MGDSSRKIDVQKLISFSEDLVEFLRNKNDLNNLTQCIEHSEALQSFCISDINEVQSSIQECENKINACKQKKDEARSEAASDAEINGLQEELEEELRRERSLREELRAVVDEISDLERQRVSIEERKQNQSRLGQDKVREHRKLSMYASVTKVIPSVDDAFKISGRIVERDRKTVEMFEFDPTKVSALELCNRIWKMIDQ
ncbi:kinetochore protein SPC24 homolog [Malania oleifera]|uniref:kinetochore protein SPC24 homolog n=1 Tax=Malania oleifera TaxID=397392 RepID=UPI0025AEC8E3|nr:kinetochore protein SPC24 homolog [Malania oleifera]